MQLRLVLAELSELSKKLSAMVVGYTVKLYKVFIP